MIKFLAVTALALSVTACATTTPAERLSANRSACEAYGFKTGTDAYANCLMQMDQAAKAEDRATKDRIRNGLLAMSQSMTPRRIRH